MKSIKILALPALFVAILISSCNNSAAKQEATTANAVTKTDTAKIVAETPAKDTAKEEVLTLNAMFVSFTLGDAEHFTFKDKSGKMWDFRGSDEPTLKFAEELPEAKANETNQGWTSNKALQKKWFDLKYVCRMQPEYIDGPMAKVPIIIEAKMQK